MFSFRNKEDGSPVKGYGRAYASDAEVRGNAEWSLKVDATGYYRYASIRPRYAGLSDDVLCIRSVRCRRTGTCLQQEEG